MRAIFDEPIPRLPKAASIPPRLENIVMRALEREPEERFQDAREMALLLQQHAFRSPGFNLIQLAAQMKGLFAADQAGWKAAAGAGLDIEDNRPRKITASFSLATSPDSHTAERTVALQASSVPEMSYLASLETEPVDSGRSSAAKAVPPNRRPSLSRPPDGREHRFAGTTARSRAIPVCATSTDVDGRGLADEGHQGAHDRRPDSTCRAIHSRRRGGHARRIPPDEAARPGPRHQRARSRDSRSSSTTCRAHPQFLRDADHRSAAPGSSPPGGQSDRGQAESGGHPAEGRSHGPGEYPARRDNAPPAVARPFRLKANALLLAAQALPGRPARAQRWSAGSQPVTSPSSSASSSAIARSSSAKSKIRAFSAMRDGLVDLGRTT